MKAKLFYIASILTLLCCSSHPGQVRIQGSFAHLEQGEFYIYSTDGGMQGIDTLSITEGKFLYSLPIDRESILYLLYPNYSQLPIFVNSGEDIHIKGDVRSLNEVEVKGSSSNELFTQFRKEMKDKSSRQIRKMAKEYIQKTPTEALSKYLFKEYFLKADSVIHEEAKELYDSLCRANPEDLTLSRMAGEVRSCGILRIGRQLPHFEIACRTEEDTTENKPVLTNKDFEGKHLLIAFWAGWKSGTQYTLTRARRLQREMKEDLHIISYSLDTDKRIVENVEKRDSLFHNNASSVCDFYCWDSPLVRQWGIDELPYIIITDSKGTIIASGSNWTLDIEPKTKDLCL